jgi:heme exporter protein D
MMPVLGKYAGVVLSSYAIAVVLIGGLVLWTLWRGARVRAALRAVEARAGRNDG